MSQPRKGPLLVAAIVVVAILVASFGWWWHVNGPGARFREANQPQPTPPSELAAPSDSSTASVAEISLPTTIRENAAGFVGTAACSECHAERVAEFVSTDHFRTSRRLDPKVMAARITDGSTKMTTSDPNVTFAIRQVGDRFFQESLRLATLPERNSEPMEIVIGAGNFDEDYFFWRGDRLFQAPLVWMHPRQTWCNASGYVDGEIDFNREVLPRCLECHTTYAEPIIGTVNGYHSESIGWGIGCERCHGPAQSHVLHHQSAPDDPEARAIVMPAEFSRSQSLDLCNQCHGNATVRRTAPFSFRPGDSVETHFRNEVSERAEEDHTSNQIHYLEQSACFQNSAMTCLSCHDPHVGREAQRQGSFASCAQCHEPESCNARATLPEAVQDRCVDCHMPRRPVANITFDLADDRYAPLIERYDHRIAVHQDAAKRVELEWTRIRPEAQWQTRTSELQAQLVELKIAEADLMASEGREAAEALALRELIELDPEGSWRERLEQSQAQRRQVDSTMHDALQAIDQRDFNQAITLLRQVIAERPDFALAHGKLGMILYETGQHEEGLAELAKVNQIDPDDGYGLALLGYIALLNKEWSTSEQHYLAAQVLDPYNAKLEFYLGTVRSELGQYQQAHEHLLKSLQIEPGRRDVQSVLASVESKLGNHDQAIMLARELAEATYRRDPVVLMRLAEVYEGAGKFGEAASALSQAAALLDPELRPALEERIEALRGQGD